MPTPKSKQHYRWPPSAIPNRSKKSRAAARRVQLPPIADRHFPPTVEFSCLFDSDDCHAKTPTAASTGHRCNNFGIHLLRGLRFLKHPHRSTQPDHIVVILRGLQDYSFEYFVLELVPHLGPQPKNDVVEFCQLCISLARNRNVASATLVTWPSFEDIHPFELHPLNRLQDSRLLQEMFNNLGELLCTITGFDFFSLQPNVGAAREYVGLMAIRAYHLVLCSSH
nr:glycine dehydrogenase (decarboxylating), mitochondrial [Ipomoea batatas]